MEEDLDYGIFLVDESIERFEYERILDYNENIDLHEKFLSEICPIEKGLDSFNLINEIILSEEELLYQIESRISPEKIQKHRAKIVSSYSQKLLIWEDYIINPPSMKYINYIINPPSMKYIK